MSSCWCLVSCSISYQRAWTLAERVARFGRKEALFHWLTLESWIGMVIDVVLIKSMDSKEEEEPTIIGSLLGSKAGKLITQVHPLFTDAFAEPSVSHYL